MTSVTRASSAVPVTPGGSGGLEIWLSTLCVAIINIQTTSSKAMYIIVVVVECICSAHIVPDNHADACARLQNKRLCGKVNFETIK